MVPDVGSMHGASTPAPVNLIRGGHADEYCDSLSAAAVPYLRLIGHLVFSFAWCYAAGVAAKKIAGGDTDPFYQSKLTTARFYFAKLYPETATLLKQVRSGAAPLMELTAENF